MLRERGNGLSLFISSPLISYECQIVWRIPEKLKRE